MKLTIMTQNLQGLNDEGCVEVVKNYYRNHLRDIDILCFQEHKLRGKKLQNLKDKIWRGAKFLVEEAEAAYNNRLDGPGAGRGGLCMWVSAHIHHLVSKTGRSRAGRAQWIRLSGIAGGDLAVLNVCAPNLSDVRCDLWIELIDTLPKDYRWLMAGD
jgi:exonuclease III